jgi:hypothetical protein
MIASLPILTALRERTPVHSFESCNILKQKAARGTARDLTEPESGVFGIPDLHQA